jgi:hypothetical protein
VFAIDFFWREGGGGGLCSRKCVTSVVDHSAARQVKAEATSRLQREFTPNGVPHYTMTLMTDAGELLPLGKLAGAICHHTFIIVCLFCVLNSLY